MSEDLLHAHRQWANRPDDERFGSLIDLQAYVDDRNLKTQESFQTYNTLKVIADNERDDVLLRIGDKEPMQLNNWSFGQMSSRVGVPAAYMSKLPAKLVSANMNYSLTQVDPDSVSMVHYMDNGDGAENTVRAFTSERYGKIPDSKIVTWLRNLEANGTWKQPLANPPGEYGGIRDSATPGGLYASDRDMFAFLIDEDKRITIGDEELARGFFVWNSEVGYKSFGLMCFLYRFVCGNNIVWGADNVIQLSTRHVGENAEIRALDRFTKAIDSFSNESAKEQTEQIAAAMDYDLGHKDASETVTWLRRFGFTKKSAKLAVETAVIEEGGADTLWQVIQGLTAVARDIPMMDERTKMEAAASKLMKLAA
jgi:hypothetical protein